MPVFLGSHVSHPLRNLVVSTLLHALFGTAVGLFQWLLLRRYVRRAAWWILSTAGGWATMWPVACLIGVQDRFLDEFGIVAFTIGLAGLIVVRGRWFQNIVYVLACWIGWNLALWTGVLTYLKLLNNPERLPVWQEALCYIAGGTMGGVVFGIITGWPLVWLLRGKAKAEASTL
jgi:hypothetical protein